MSLRPGVTERNVNRIRRGMSLAEVETILGPPSRCRCMVGGHIIPLEQRHERLTSDGCASVGWSVDGVEVGAIDFGQDGRVIHVFFDLPAASSPPLFTRLRAWLGW